MVINELDVSLIEQADSLRHLSRGEQRASLQSVMVENRARAFELCELLGLDPAWLINEPRSAARAELEAFERKLAETAVR
jgi:hypothetical protein